MCLVHTQPVSTQCSAALRAAAVQTRRRTARATQPPHNRLTIDSQPLHSRRTAVAAAQPPCSPAADVQPAVDGTRRRLAAPSTAQPCNRHTTGSSRVAAAAQPPQQTTAVQSLPRSRNHASKPSHVAQPGSAQPTATQQTHSHSMGSTVTTVRADSEPHHVGKRHSSKWGSATMAAVDLRALDDRSASAVSALTSSQRCSPTDTLEAHTAGQPRSPIAAT